MLSVFLARFNSDWFASSVDELTDYFGHMFTHMSVTHWSILSASAVAFGFLCLRGTGLSR